MDSEPTDSEAIMDVVAVAAVAATASTQTPPPSGDTGSGGAKREETPQAPLLQERLKLQYGTWMDEYKALRSEISAVGTSARQGTQVSIVALAAQVSLAAYIVQNDLSILFLIAPFIFYGLTWTQLRLVYAARSLSDYVHKNITEGVAWTLGEIAPVVYPPPARIRTHYEAKPLPPLEWDAVSRREMNSYKKRLWLIESSAFLIPLVTAILLPGAYLAYNIHYHAPISRYATAYILLNEVACIYTLMIGTWMRRFRQGLNDYEHPSPARYCDLLVGQLWHYVVILFSPICPRLVRACRYTPPEEWYVRPVPATWLKRYRRARFALWVLIGSVTFYSIHTYNAAQGQYAAGHRTTLTLLNKQSISGVQIGFEGRNYIMLVGNTKEEIDASLVGSFNPEVARSAAAESLNRRAQTPTRVVPRRLPRPAPKLPRATGQTEAKDP